MYTTTETPLVFTKSRTVEPAKRKILLVEDDPAIRQDLFRLLAGEGFLVVTAASGVEAVELVNAKKFDLVLLDLSMSVEDGWETLGRLLAQDPLSLLILITDCPDRFFHAVALGAGALLEKPLAFTRLFQTIQSLLKEPAVFHTSRSWQSALQKSEG